MPPVCFRSAKIRPDSVVTSRAISVRIASAVFFLRGKRILRRPSAADQSIDLNELTDELLEATEFGNLSFGFFLSGGTRKRFGNGPALHFVGQPRIRAVRGLTGPMTTAV
jgi:hypothetical protein